MNISYLEIVSFVLAGVGVGGTFVPRFPSSTAAYLSMICMALSGVPYFDAKVLIFWGVATLIVFGLEMLQPRALTATRHGHAYVAAGTVVGALLGYLASPTASAIILGAALGAFFGTMAFMRTPKGTRFAVASSEFMQYLCAKGLPAVVAISMVTLTVASAL